MKASFQTNIGHLGTPCLWEVALHQCLALPSSFMVSTGKSDGLTTFGGNFTTLGFFNGRRYKALVALRALSREISAPNIMLVFNYWKPTTLDTDTAATMFCEVRVIKPAQAQNKIKKKQCNVEETCAGTKKQKKTTSGNYGPTSG